MAHKRKLEKDIRCPLEYGLDVFGGRWKSRILCVLAAHGTLRYSELRNQLANISDAVLSSEVKELIGSGMVTRRSYDEIPPRVEYTLTDQGLSVIPILQSICQWAGLFTREVKDDAPAHCKACDFHGRKAKS